MSPAQTKLYWRLWGAAVRARKAAGLPEPDRHEVHREALGVDKSSKEFTNGEFDRVMGVLLALGNPDDLGGQLRQGQQRRTRMLHALRADLLPKLAEAITAGEELSAGERLVRAQRYAGRIMANKFKVMGVEDLGDDELRVLIMDVARAVRKKGAKVSSLKVQDSREEVGDPF